MSEGRAAGGTLPDDGGKPPADTGESAGGGRRAGRGVRGRGSVRGRRFVLFGIASGVAGFALFQFGLASPEQVEAAYTGGAYRWVVALFAGVSGWFPFSVAELLVGAAALFVVARRVRRIWQRFTRRPVATDPGPTVPRPGALRQLVRLGLVALAGTGILYAAFVLVWGLNYARPRLEARFGLSTDGIGNAEVARLARRVAAETTRDHRRARLPEDRVSENPLDLRELSREIDAAYDELGLPGDPRPAAAAPVKPAVFSELMSRMGVSGIFVPFTGEPTVNTQPPEVAVAFTAAHEKAHQRAVTHEGEASFVAWLALSRGRRHPYLRYAASFFAARHLLAASRHADAPTRERIWAALGPGPRRDLDALNRFWAQHRGVVRGAAQRVNDSYLRTMRVPDGVASYGTVVRLLIGDLRRRPATPAEPTTDTED